MSLECLAPAIAIPALGTSFFALVAIGSLKLMLDEIEADDRRKDWTGPDENVVENWVMAFGGTGKKCATELETGNWVVGTVLLLLLLAAPTIPCVIEGWLADPSGLGGPPLDSDPVLWGAPASWPPGVHPAPSPGRHRLPADGPVVWTAAGHQPAPAAVPGLNAADMTLGPVLSTVPDPVRDSVAPAPVFGQQFLNGPAEERNQSPPMAGKHPLTERVPSTIVSAAVRPCGNFPDQAPAVSLLPLHCVPVLTRDTCPHGFWRIQLTDSFVSVCAPRLCDPGRVFIPADQLCHDIREDGLCDNGLRPYLTGSAAPVCDCEEGQFRDQTGRCVDLFSTAECEDQQSWHVSEDGSLQCAQDTCAGLDRDSDGDPKYADIDGLCYEYGTRGPCVVDAVLGFSPRLIGPICAELTEPMLDDDEPVTSRRDGLMRLMTSPPAWRRQSTFPTRVVRAPLLTRCGAGIRVDSLFTCRDIIFPGRFAGRSGSVLPPEQPNFACNQVTSLSADGRCVAPGQAGTPVCGPGQVLDPAGRCRPVNRIDRRQYTVV